MNVYLFARFRGFLPLYILRVGGRSSKVVNVSEKIIDIISMWLDGPRGNIVGACEEQNI